MTTTLTTTEIQSLVANLATKKGAQLEQLAQVLIRREFLLTDEEFTINIAKNDLDKNIYSVLRQWNDWNNTDVESEVVYQCLNRATKDGMTDLDKAGKELVKMTKAVLYLGSGLLDVLTGCTKVKEELNKVQKELDDLTSGE